MFVEVQSFEFRYRIRVLALSNKLVFWFGYRSVVSRYWKGIILNGIQVLWWGI